MIDHVRLVHPNWEYKSREVNTDEIYYENEDGSSSFVEAGLEISKKTAEVYADESKEEGPKGSIHSKQNWWEEFKSSFEVFYDF